MRNEEVGQVIQFLNSMWANKPLDQIAAGVWGSELREFQFDDVMANLRQLAREQNWRPALAQILKPLVPKPEGKEPGQVFADICEQITKRPPVVSAAESEAVRRLGGWDVLRAWQLDDLHWHEKRFRVIWAELCEQQARPGFTALPEPQPNQPALPGETPARPAPAQADRLADILKGADFMKEREARQAQGEPLSGEELERRRAELKAQAEELKARSE